VALQRVSFIVIDGLDECSDEEMHQKHTESQREVIDWLQALITTTRATGPGTDPGHCCLRLLVSSQRNGYLEQRLRDYPQIQLESVPGHEQNIKVYVETKIRQLKDEKPGVTEQMQQDILRKVCSAAKGE